jgi:hypothetical protein
MFFFFSNGVGLIGSIVISVVLTLVLLNSVRDVRRGFFPPTRFAFNPD